MSPALVEGVPVALDRALTNLLDNAIGVSGTGSRIRIGAGEVGEWAWIRWPDQGPGFPRSRRVGASASGSPSWSRSRGHEGALVSSRA